MKHTGLVLLLALAAGPALAQPKPTPTPRPAAPTAPAQPAPAAPTGLGTFGSNSRDPINIEADKLEVFDKDQKAVYSGNVVVVQGETTMKSGEMVVYYARGEKGATPAPAAAGAPPAQQEGTTLRRVEAFGGVSIVSKDQIATGRTGIFDRENNSVILTGDVALTENGNVTKGEKLVYNLTTGKAVVEANSATGRVKSSLMPGADDKAGKPAAPAKPTAPAPAPAPAAPKPPARP